jgi:hypothetical protein
MPTARPSPSRKQLRDFRKLPRSPVGSYMYKAKVDKEKPYHYLISAFLPTVLTEWIANYLGHRLAPRHKFLTYEDPDTDNGVYPLGDPSVMGGQPDPNGEIRVSLAGDWGTGTEEAHRVAQQMTAFAPHYTIHLGDVYYVGDDNDVKENCLGLIDDDPEIQPCKWPYGSVGTFALNGNHEMYALGNAYFDRFLPELGFGHRPDGRPAGQKASFFCLQNDYWTLIALDTGYNSISVPILEYLFPPSSKLRPENVEWVAEQVKPQASQRGLILLSHHQYFSQFEKQWFPGQAQQLKAYVNRPVLWFWGHEHRMAIYGKHSFKDGLEAYGRCVGHGGMPVDINSPTRHADCPAVISDNRTYSQAGADGIGFNGYVNLNFKQNQLRVEYKDVNGNLLITEDWETRQGLLFGKNCELVDKDLTLGAGKTPADALR